MSSYTQFGPFANGQSPPINSSFLNGLESFLSLINALAIDANISADGNGAATLIELAINSGSTVLNGATAGTATLYQPLNGVLKLVMCYLSGFRNGGGSAQTIAIPTPFVTSFRWWVGDINPLTFVGSSSNRTSDIVTALASGGGTVTSQTTVNKYSHGGVNAAVDTISFNASEASAHTGLILMIGV
jgi:hypothetical protein